MDEDGYVWYQGRNDDLIKSAGYRIGPAEVEDTLLRHPAVARRLSSRAPTPNVAPSSRRSSGSRRDIGLPMSWWRRSSSSSSGTSPPTSTRVIEFVDAFPLTSSGKTPRGELRRREFEAKDA